MAIEDNYLPTKVVGNGVTTVFTFSWDGISTAFVKVFFQNVSTGVITEQTTGFTKALNTGSAGGSITFTTAPTSSNYVIIARETPKSQTDPYNTSSGFQASVVENNFDKVVAMLQETVEKSNRAISFPLGTDVVGLGYSTDLPTPEAGKALAWNEDEDALINVTADSGTAAAEAEAAAAAADASADAAAASAVAAAAAVANLSGKNIVINGDFSVWQRGATFTALATGSYAADRWRIAHSMDGVVDILRAADAPTAAQAGVYAPYSIHADVTTADATIAAGQSYQIQHRIEGNNIKHLGFGQAGTRYLTLSFWVKATKTGTYCVAFGNSAANRSYVAEYTVSVADTWEKKTVTIAVDTSGTWLYDTGLGLAVYFMLACGSTFQTTAGSWQAGTFLATANQVNALDSTSNNFKLALVQLEAGEDATDFDALPFGEQLALCQRYFWKTFDYATAPAQNVASQNGAISYIVDVAGVNSHGEYASFPVPMRASPTIVFYSTHAASTTWYNGTDAGNSGASSSYAKNERGFLAINAQVAGDGVGEGCQIHATAEAEV